MQIKSSWKIAKVKHGSGQGKLIGFPTANLDPLLWDKSLKEGVYSAEVKYRGTVYLGALYYGPRLVMDEINNVLEIYILGFSHNIYNQEVAFKILKFIRPPLDFKDLGQLKKQLASDISAIKISAEKR